MIERSTVRRIRTVSNYPNALNRFIDLKRSLVTRIDLVIDGGAAAGPRWGFGNC
jgi:hypothetical protein